MSRPHPSPLSSRVCPWWLIRGFDNPFRRILQNPERILQEILQPGDNCLDLGCGIGFFAIPMARLVGPSGRVTAVDLQPEMLAGVKRRAEKAGVMSRVRLHLVDSAGLHLEDLFDFVLAFWMMHEVPDQKRMIKEIRGVLRGGGLFLLVEPKWHVKEAVFRRTVGIAKKAGFAQVREPRIFFSHAILMIKEEDL